MKDSMSRRGFVGAAALGAAMMVDGIAAFAQDQSEPLEAGQTVPTITDDDDLLCERGGTTLTVERLNRIRRERVEAANGFTAEDGTEIKPIWHKLATLIDTYGWGGPDPDCGDPYGYVTVLFENDEDAAAHWLEMPWGKIFTPTEYAQRSGRTIEECTQICDDLALRGLLFKATHSDGEPTYHHIAYVHGFMEQSLPRMYDPELTAATYDSFLFAPTNPGLVAVGTPIYYSVPCDVNVVSDQRILPLNDYRGVVERNECIAVVPCCCSLRENVRQGAEVPPLGSEELKEFRNVFGDNHLLERCLVFGEEAEFFLEMGVGRKITKDEALEILDRNVNEEGLVVQLGYTNNSQVICSCHSDCCGVLGNYRLFDPETLAASPIMQNASNFLLEYDKDSCISCGACAQRCPMKAITMGEDGHPEVDIYCVRCGQCGLVCPVGARTLTARPAQDRLPVPDNHMDDHNRKFGYRVEHGMR